MTTPEQDIVPDGFLFNAVRAGIKASANLDLACVIAPRGAAAAAMFTRNRVVAAPIVVGREHLAESAADMRVVLVNAGNANCATGQPGIQACRAVCDTMATVAGVATTQVFPSSTGIIGVPFPTQQVENSIEELVAGLGRTAEHVERVAHAIMTTDTRPKLSSALIERNRQPIKILGIAKGAGMIHPDMATMLAFLFTDAVLTPDQLQALLSPAVEESFNSISIDGDTSTNDTVLLVASGASGVSWEADDFPRDEFTSELRRVCSDLAQQIVDDGEGVGHVVTIEIDGARTREDAVQVAKAIAHSPLVKTAWAGSDPNWGRILAAVGSCGVPISAEAISISIGSSLVFDRGTRVDFDEQAVHREMQNRNFSVRVTLGQGPGCCRFLTTDLTEEYVRINADYST